MIKYCLWDHELQREYLIQKAIGLQRPLHRVALPSIDVLSMTNPRQCSYQPNFFAL